MWLDFKRRVYKVIVKGKKLKGEVSAKVVSTLVPTLVLVLGYTELPPAPLRDGALAGRYESAAGCFTTSGYMIRTSYAPKLLERFRSADRARRAPGGSASRSWVALYTRSASIARPPGFATASPWREAWRRARPNPRRSCFCVGFRILKP